MKDPVASFEDRVARVGALDGPPSPQAGPSRRRGGTRRSKQRREHAEILDSVRFGLRFPGHPVSRTRRRSGVREAAGPDRGDARVFHSRASGGAALPRPAEFERPTADVDRGDDGIRFWDAETTGVRCGDKTELLEKCACYVPRDHRFACGGQVFPRPAAGRVGVDRTRPSSAFLPIGLIPSTDPPREPSKQRVGHREYRQQLFVMSCDLRSVEANDRPRGHT